MIQPATPSLLAPSSARPSPRLVGGGIAFALPLEEGDDASLLTGPPAGGGRHDDAVAGKLLPIDGAPAFDPGTGETIATAPLLPDAPRPVVPTDEAADASPMPAPRSAKFGLPFPAVSSLPRALASSAVEPDSTLDADRGSARPDEVGAPPEPGALAQPVPTAVVLIATLGTATPQPAATPDPTSTAPFLASVQTAAPSRTDLTSARTRSNADPVAPAPVDPAPTPPVVAASTPTAMVSAAALATSSLTPLDVRASDRLAPPTAPAAPAAIAPVFAGTAPAIDDAPSRPISTAMPMSRSAPVPVPVPVPTPTLASSDAQLAIGTRGRVTAAPDLPTVAIDTMVTIGRLVAPAIPSPLPRTPVGIPAAQSDRATITLTPPTAAEQMTIAVPAETVAARAALSPLATADAPPTIADDTAMRSPLPSSTTGATAKPANNDTPSQPLTVATRLRAREQSMPSSSGTTATTLPAGWQWAPRSAVPVAAFPTPIVAPPIMEPPIAAVDPTPNPLPAVSIPVDRPAITAQPSAPPSTAIPTAAMIGTPVSIENRAEAPLALPLPIPTAASAPLAPPATSAPAAIVFGAARFAAQVADDRDEPAAPLGLVPLAAPQTIERAVAGVAATSQAPLDLRQEHWPHAMIERIEMIRDAADAVDTRIRLVPDALGAIDVEVKRDGDTLNVRFHAEQAQTRTLLADAAPRLAEAAEARGLRLSQSGVGGDAGSPGHGQPRQPLPAAPPRAPRSPAADPQAGDDDTRLA